VKLETVCCNIESDNPAIPGGPFDAIYFMDVIEHLKNPVKALENIRALMANDGMLIIHTPNVYRPGTFLRYLISGPGAFARGIGSTPDFHFQTYDYLTLEKTLEFVGLRVAEVVPTRMTFPVIGKFGRLRRTGAWKAGSRLASKRWPFLSDTLLVVCTKTDPVDINSWVEQRKVREGDSPQSG